MIGRSVSHYRVLEKLGAGGMGEVYLAEDTRLNRRVALKVLPTGMADDPERLERFAREAQAIGGLNHPNIVTIHSIEEADGLHLLVMELVEGRTLSEEIPPGGLSEERFFELAIPLADAVSAAHERGVTHRDLKPSNVMISGDGRVKVVDFGLAKLRQETQARERTVALDSDLTEEGRILGTYPYMAPEQLKGKPVDHRSDIFSLGVVLYEMATGARPFEGETSADLISAILRDTPDPVDVQNPRLPRHLHRIIDHCLEKDPDRRFQTAKDLRNELQSLRQELESDRLLRSTSIGRRLTTAGSRWRGARGWITAGILGALAVAMVLWFALQGPDDPHREADRTSAGLTGTASSSATRSEASRPSVAVLFFQNLTGDAELEWLRNGFPEMLVTGLSQSPALRVVSTDRLYQILQDLDSLDAEVVSSDLVEEVAERTGVGAVILGSFARAGDTLQVNITLQDPETGEILDARRVQGSGEASVFSIVDRLSTDVLRTFERAGQVERIAREDLERRIESVTTSSLEAYQFYVEGVRLSYALKIDEALALFERALELDPGFAMAHAQLAKMYETLGREEALEDALEEAVAHSERLPPRERYYVEGSYYGLHRSTYGRSIEILEEAVDTYPDHNVARERLGLLYSYLERHEAAAAEFRELLRRGHRSVGAYNNLAQMYGALDRPQDARRLIEGWLEEEPTSWSAHLVLAWHAINWGDLEAAFSALERAETLRPGSPFVDFMLWRAATAAGRWTEARRHADALLDHGDPYWRWRGSVGRALVALFRGDVQSGLDHLDEAAGAYGDARPLSGTAWNLAAKSQLLLGRPADVVAAADRARAAAEGNWPATESLFWRARAQQQLGDTATADLAATELAEIAKQMPGAVEERLHRRLRGLLAFARGDVQAALRDLEAAVTDLPPRGLPWHRHRVPDHVPLWYELATVRQAVGDAQGAESLLRRIVDSGVEHTYHPIQYVRSHYELARLLEERGEVQEARDLYRTFLDFWGDGTIDRDRVAGARRRLVELE